MTTTAPRVTPMGTLRDRFLQLAERITTPLVPADYLDIIDPLRSSTELRGRIIAIHPETRDAVSVVIKPGRGWRIHTPGQYIRIGVDVDGVRQWRAYSLTSDTDQADGCITITVKAIPGGKVSNHLVRRATVGTIVQLGHAAGEFTLPAAAPAKILFLTAGSGITPVMGMLRNMAEHIDDVVVVHSAPKPDDVIFAGELRMLARQGRIRLIEKHTDTDGVLGTAELDALVDDLAERETWACGPTGMLDTLERHWDDIGIPNRLHTERFRPTVVTAGQGGTVTFTKSATVLDTPGRPNAARRRRSRRSADAVGMPNGHLLRLRGTAAPRSRARPAQRRHHHRRTRRRRPHPNLCVCSSRHLRHRTVEGTDMTTLQRQQHNPIAHLSDDDIANLGRELEAIRQQVLDSRGERDAAYIRNVIDGQRKLELGSRAVLLFSLFPPAWLIGTVGLSVSKIIENMEIGHNVMHGQWDWMRDSKIHSTTWEWDNASPSELWKHSHNEVHHTYTNVLGKDNDLGYGIMRVDEDQRWKPFYLGQPLWNFLNACIFQYGIAAYDLQIGKYLKGKTDKEEFRGQGKKVLGKIGRHVTRDYLLYPLLSGPSA